MSQGSFSRMVANHKVDLINFNKPTKWTIAVKIDDGIIHINEYSFSQFSPVIASISPSLSDEKELPTFPGTMEVWKWMAIYCEVCEIVSLDGIDRGMLIYVMEFLQFPKKMVSTTLGRILMSEKIVEDEKWSFLPLEYHSQVLEAYCEIVNEHEQVEPRMSFMAKLYHSRMVVKRNMLAFHIAKILKLDTEEILIKAFETTNTTKGTKRRKIS